MVMPSIKDLKWTKRWKVHKYQSNSSNQFISVSSLFLRCYKEWVVPQTMSHFWRASHHQAKAALRLQFQDRHTVEEGLVLMLPSTTLELCLGWKKMNLIVLKCKKLRINRDSVWLKSCCWPSAWLAFNLHVSSRFKIYISCFPSQPLKNNQQIRSHSILFYFIQSNPIQYHVLA